VELTDGTRLQETVEAPRGSEISFASEAEVVAKFMKLASPSIGEGAAKALAERVLNMERIADAEDIVRALVKPPIDR